jgi:hypothetical protein
MPHLYCSAGSRWQPVLRASLRARRPLRQMLNVLCRRPTPVAPRRLTTSGVIHARTGTLLDVEEADCCVLVVDAMLHWQGGANAAAPHHTKPHHCCSCSTRVL